MSEDRFEEAKRVLTDENWQDLWCPWCPPQFELFKWCVEEIERLRALWQAHLEPGGTVSNVPPIRVLTKQDMAKMDPPFPPEPNGEASKVIQTETDHQVLRDLEASGGVSRAMSCPKCGNEDVGTEQLRDGADWGPPLWVVFAEGGSQSSAAILYCPFCGEKLPPPIESQTK